MDRDVISFTAYVGNKYIRCAISWEALGDHFGGDHIAPLDAFRANRSAVEKIAKRLIEQKRFEYDNSILIRSHDCSSG